MMLSVGEILMLPFFKNMKKKQDKKSPKTSYLISLDDLNQKRMFEGERKNKCY